MAETAYVTKIDGEFAVVEMDRSSACDKCGSCKTTKSGKMTGKALNKAGANIGDTVMLGIKGSFLGVASVTYLVPLIMFFLGYYFGAELLNGGELQGIIGAFALMTLSFGFVIIYDRYARSKGKYQLEIKRVKRREGFVPQ